MHASAAQAAGARSPWAAAPHDPGPGGGASAPPPAWHHLPPWIRAVSALAHVGSPTQTVTEETR